MQNAFSPPLPRARRPRARPTRCCCCCTSRQVSKAAGGTTIVALWTLPFASPVCALSETERFLHPLRVRARAPSASGDDRAARPLAPTATPSPTSGAFLRALRAAGAAWSTRAAGPFLLLDYCVLGPSGRAASASGSASGSQLACRGGVEATAGLCCAALLAPVGLWVGLGPDFRVSGFLGGARGARAEGPSTEAL